MAEVKPRVAITSLSLSFMITVTLSCLWRGRTEHLWTSQRSHFRPHLLSHCCIFTVAIVNWTFLLGLLSLCKQNFACTTIFLHFLSSTLQISTVHSPQCCNIIKCFTLNRALCSFNAMLQCLTQLIIRQTSIRFHSLPTAADHGTELFFLQITRHFGGCCDHMLELSLCCVPKVCAQRSLAMYSPMSYVGSHL